MNLLTSVSAFLIVSICVASTSISAAPMACLSNKPCACPDMSQYKGVLPEGWHNRFNDKIQANTSNKLAVVIFEQVDKKDKNNFYCRYINDGNTFVLSTMVPVKSVGYTNKQYWRYDEEDDLWECHPHTQEGVANTADCKFYFK